MLRNMNKNRIENPNSKEVRDYKFRRGGFALHLVITIRICNPY